MSNLITVFISFLTSIIQVDAFLYVLASFSVFSVFLLIRKVVYG